MQLVGWPFLILFILSSIISTLLVNPRGLYLTVVSIPILFALFIVLTGWLVNRSELPEGGDPFSATSFIFSVYPLMQVFPALATGFIGAIIIAVVRLQLLKRYNTQVSRRQLSRRQRAAEDDRRNRRIAQRARARTNQVTVQELLERSQARRGSSSSTSVRARRPIERLDDDSAYRDRYDD